MTVFLWQFFDESLKEHLEVFLLGQKEDAETHWVVMIMECVWCFENGSYTFLLAQSLEFREPLKNVALKWGPQH